MCHRRGAHTAVVKDVTGVIAFDSDDWTTRSRPVTRRSRQTTSKPVDLRAATSPVVAAWP